jgi:predicted ATPase
LPFDVALSIAGSIASGLEYAHANGVIHGDLKPKNVLMTSEIKISDFGLGRLESGRSLINIDVPLSLVTARYLAPEQVLGHPIDARTDLYAFGVILYEMFTGQLPFDGSDQEVLEFHRSRSPVPPREINPDLSRSLEHLILKLLDKDPNRRYAKARQVRRILSGMSAAISGKVQRRTFTLEPQPSLAGREDILARMTELWAETQQGQGQIVFISGEVGIGKTRVAQELISCLDEATVLLGNCLSLEGSPAYQPFLSAISTYLNNVPAETVGHELGQVWREITALVPEVKRVMPRVASTAAGDEPLHPPPLSLVHSLGLAMTNRPWLLILDDLHWIDDRSLILLDYLAQHCNRLPLMIVGLYDERRLDESQALADTIDRLSRLDNCQLIGLEQLSEGEVKEQLEGLWTHLVPANLVTVIYNCTGGNPLYVEEVARGLVDEGVVSWRDNKWDFGSVIEASLPQQIDEAILRRLNNLSRETRTFLNQAAVFDPVINFDDLHEMSDLSEWDALESLDIALDRQILKEAPGERMLRFGHARIQEVLYQGLSSLRRRLMHREAGEALERQYPAEPKEIPVTLAHHFFQAGELEKGLIYSIQAARQAGAIYAHENALHWYTQAMDAMDQLGLENLYQQQRFELLLAREQNHYHLGNRQAQRADLTALQHLGQLLNLPAKQAVVHNRRAALALVANHLDEASTEARAGLIAARQASEALLIAENLLQLGQLASLRGRFDEALEQLEAAYALLEETSDHGAKIRCLTGLSTLHKLLNNFAESENYDQQALEMSKLSGDRYDQANALGSLGHTWFRTGNYAKARSCQQQALIINQFIGSRQGEAACSNRLATIYNELGDYKLAQGYVERAASIHRDIEDEAGLAEDYQVFGTIYRASGDLEFARNYFEQALEVYRRSDRKVQEGSAWLELAMTHESLRDLTAASHAYQQARTIFSDLGNENSTCEANAGLARCFLAKGEIESAQQLVESFPETSDQNGMFRYPIQLYLTTYRVLAAVDHAEQAVAALQHGHALLQQRANAIEDTQLKLSYLEDVPENKELLLQLERHQVTETTN